MKTVGKLMLMGKITNASHALSHRVLRSMRETNYCIDTRPGAQLEASQEQDSELCKQLQAAEITLHTILLGVGGIVYTAHTLDLLEHMGIDPQRSTKLA
eukprot:1142891-Pelagomonas_calceolata.AAC.2